MPRLLLLALALLVLGLLPFLAQPVVAQNEGPLTACRDFAFSTEEDFVTQGPMPPDGNPIVSDGDLLGDNHTVCVRNADLVQKFDVRDDMGLDAVDVINADSELVAFSTELDSPHGNFTHGDLLTTKGAAIPNVALLYSLTQEAGLPELDAGLDAVHFVGSSRAIEGLLGEAAGMSREEYIRRPDALLDQLRQWDVDIWFSIEGTLVADRYRVLDGDLLSARDGNKVASNDQLLHNAVPAGIPDRGVDFGLDGATASRDGDRKVMRFTTEILFVGQPAFTDGDILSYGNGVVITGTSIYRPFEPKADFLGTDALHTTLEGGEPWYLFIPRIVKGILDALS